MRRSGIEKRNTFFDRNSGEENVKMETWPNRTAQKRELDLAQKDNDVIKCGQKKDASGDGPDCSP